MAAMGLVVVVTGPPGAGKSAMSEELVELLDPSALVPGDAFFGFLRNGAIPPWREEAHAQNTAVMQAAAAATGRLAQHRHVIYEGVVGPWFLDTFLRAAGVTHVHYLMLLPPLEVCLERVRTRPGHRFTDRGAAEHMWWELHTADVASQHVLGGHLDTPADLARRAADLLRTGAARFPQPSTS